MSAARAIDDPAAQASPRTLLRSIDGATGAVGYYSRYAGVLIEYDRATERWVTPRTHQAVPLRLQGAC